LLAKSGKTSTSGARTTCLRCNLEGWLLLQSRGEGTALSWHPKRY